MRSLDSTLTDLWRAISDKGAWASVVPIVTGSFLLSRIAPWLASEKDFDGLLIHAKEILMENLAKTHRRVFKAIDEYNPLRGDASDNVRDVLGDFSREAFRMSHCWFQLSATKMSFCFWHRVIVATVVLGAVAGLIGALLECSRGFVGCAGIALIGLQITAIMQNIRLYGKAKGHVEGL